MIGEQPEREPPLGTQLAPAQIKPSHVCGYLLHDVIIPSLPTGKETAGESFGTGACAVTHGEGTDGKSWSSVKRWISQIDEVQRSPVSRAEKARIKC